MSEAVLLSICIPAYNRPIWLERTLKSIVSRELVDLKKVEIIVTDDSSDQAQGVFVVMILD